MKHLILIIALFMVLGINAQERKTNNQQETLLIVVDGIENKKGNLMVGLYDSSENHMKKVACGFKIAVTDVTMEIEAAGVKDGEYSVAVYHDVNNNGKMDSGLFGIPTEKYGFSNNAKGFMGAPSFENSKIEFPKQKVVRIHLH